MQQVTVIGAGPAGCTIALYLARKGYQVEIFEKRGDLRKIPTDFGRSINMALMSRGIHTLIDLHLFDKVSQVAVPMRARAIHSANGDVNIQPFGRHVNEYIYAVSRTQLNHILLDAVMCEKNISVHFNKKLIDVDFNNHTLTFCDRVSNKNYQHAIDQVIGADGAGSRLRSALAKANLMTVSKQSLAHGYKELMIAPQYSDLYPKETLLSWPRETFMLLGNPNIDNSWTLTLFLPLFGENSFDAIQNESQLQKMFHTFFPNVMSHVQNLGTDYFSHPTGKLGTVATCPWYYEDKYLLIGDAAHAIVPFFGQGMNSTLEDCYIFDRLLPENTRDWESIFFEFYQGRKSDIDAVAQMSMDNYIEIRDTVVQPTFMLRKQMEQALMERYGQDFLTKHVMVMFYRYPYAYVKACGAIQDVLFDQLCQRYRNVVDLDWADVDICMKQYWHSIGELRHMIGSTQ